MITLRDLDNVISYGEHSVLLEINEKKYPICSFVEVTDEIFDADYFYIGKEKTYPLVYKLLFLTLLHQLKPAKGITDDNYETLKMMMKEKFGLIIYWKVGKVKKYLLQL